ncbi:DUF2793 domain-containing protein [Rhodobacterales bacterium FZCC0069]|nr:DUF2793 domain-containing protein [Rhodobacterales bacterium FZCC0069]
MTLSPNLALPFLSAAQAQKHVTVNEALTRLDGVVQLRLSGIDINLPPANPAEGSIYAVGATAQDDFAGHAGQLALFSNGGWDYITPAIGWQGYDVGAREILRFDGVTWQRPQISGAPLGGGVEVRSTSLDLVIAPGASATTDPIFPERSIGMGGTGLVTSTLTGTLGTWSIGVADDPL